MKTICSYTSPARSHEGVITTLNHKRVHWIYYLILNIPRTWCGFCCKGVLSLDNEPLKGQRVRAETQPDTPETVAAWALFSATPHNEPRTRPRPPDMSRQQPHTVHKGNNIQQSILGGPWAYPDCPCSTLNKLHLWSTLIQRGIVVGDPQRLWKCEAVGWQPMKNCTLKLPELVWY